MWKVANVNFACVAVEDYIEFLGETERFIGVSAVKDFRFYVFAQCMHNQG